MRKQAITAPCTDALALSFTCAIGGDRQNGISMSTVQARRRFNATCGILLKLYIRDVIVALDDKLAHSLCDYLGGGMNVPKIKIIDKPVTATDLVLIEQIGRLTCQQRQIAKDRPCLQGVGLLPKGILNVQDLDVHHFSIVEKARGLLGSFATISSAGKEDSLLMFEITETLSDVETFSQIGSETLWDLARVKLDPLDVDDIIKWIHNEHPQIGAIILRLAGVQKSAKILQSSLLFASLRTEIILRIAYSESPSSIILRAIASQAAFLAYRHVRSEMVGRDYALDVCQAMDSASRSAFLLELAKRDEDLGSEINDAISKNGMKVAT